MSKNNYYPNHQGSNMNDEVLNCLKTISRRITFFVHLSSTRRLHIRLQLAIITQDRSPEGAVGRGGGAPPQTPGRLAMYGKNVAGPPHPLWGSAPDPAGCSRPQTPS